MGIAQAAGGVASLTAVLVILTGILGAVLGPWVGRIPMPALVAVMVMVSIGTFSWASIANLRRHPPTSSAVMLATVVVVVATRDLSLGVLTGVLLSGIFFAAKVQRARKRLAAMFMELKLTPKMFEALIMNLRGHLDEIRRLEREIMFLCIKQTGMPRKDFISTFPKNETNVRWIDKHVRAKRKHSAALGRLKPFLFGCIPVASTTMLTCALVFLPVRVSSASTTRSPPCSVIFATLPLIRVNLGSSLETFWKKSSRRPVARMSM